MNWLWLGFLLSAIVVGVIAIVLAIYTSERGSQRAGWWMRVTALSTAGLFLLSIWTGIANLVWG